MTEQDKQSQLNSLMERKLYLEAKIRNSESLISWLDVLLDYNGDIEMSLKTKEGIQARNDAIERIEIKAELDSINKQIKLIEQMNITEYNIDEE